MFLIRTFALATIALMLCGCTFPLSPLMIIMLAEEPAQTQEADVSDELPEAQMSARVSAASDNNA